MWVMTNMANHAYPKYMSAIIFLALFVGLVNASAFGYALYRANSAATVDLSGFNPPTDTDVCPGDTLNYSFTLSVSRDAVVDVSTSIQPLISIRPSYTRLQQFDFDKETSFELVRHYVIPPTYTDPASGVEVKWQPGKYVQRTIVYVNGRSEGEDELEVPFTILPDCE